MNILIACGGTGGHLFPGIAVAETLEKRGHKVLLLISEKKVDAQASQKYGLLKFKTVPAIAKPSIFSLKMIPFLLNLRKSIKECKKIIQEHQCEVILGMGGFTSLPPIYAAKKLNLETYIHDSNALPGKANRLTSRWCNKVLLGLDAAKSYFPANKVIVTGTPIRKELTIDFRKDRARSELNLETDSKVILVMGGSQGAKKLNSIFVETAKILYSMSLPRRPINFLHITGDDDFKRIKKQTKNLKGYKVISFCDDMRKVYAACDITVCRAGASSLTELAYVNMPSVLIPYPYAADDHQTANAQVFEQAGAALLRQESNLTSHSLANDLYRIIHDNDRLKKMASRANALAVKNAADQICNVITKATLS